MTTRPTKHRNPKAMANAIVPATGFGRQGGLAAAGRSEAMERARARRRRGAG